MATKTNVEYYEKMKELQEIQHDSERKRLDLNQQLNSYMKSDHRLARLKAVRLQNYWKKICEDEKKSKWRNEQLLRDLDRIESHLSTLSTRTDRLRTMKKQYEDYIEKTYPNWKEKILHNQRLQQQQQRQHLHHFQTISDQPLPRSMTNVQPQTAAIVAPQAAAMTPQASMVTPQTSMVTPQTHAVSVNAPSGYISLPDHSESYRISTTLPPPLTNNTQVNLDTSYGFGTTPPFRGQNIHQDQVAHPFSNEKIPTDPLMNQKNQPVLRQQSMEQVANSGASQMKQDPQVGASKEEAWPTAASVVARVMTQQDEGEGHVVIPVVQDEQEGLNEVQEEEIAAVVSPRRPSGHGELNTPEVLPQNQAHAKANAQHHMVDDTDDFDSDMSLPLSGDDKLPDASPAPVSMATAATAQQRSAPDRVQSPESLYLRPDITLDGLYTLFSAKKKKVPTATVIQKQALYRDSPPEKSVKQEICQNANKSRMLSHLNLTSISMVALDQLPLLVMSCERGCLLPNDILYKPSPTANQGSVRTHIHPTSQGFWDRLFHHLLHLLKYKVMDDKQIGGMFGPHLIAEDSPYEEKAQILLTSVMAHADPDVIESPASTTTFSTLSPRKRPDEPDPPKGLLPENANRPPVIKEATKPAGQSGKASNSSSDEDGDFFDQPAPKPDPPQTSTMPLTQTAAYRQLLGDTLSTSQKSVSYEDSDDDDDIENMLGTMQKDSVKKPTSPPPPYSGNDRPFSPPGLGSRVSSPSGASTGGYLPSALDAGAPKSATGSLASIGKNAKKGPAFSFGGDSDTDEDVDIPGMGSGSKKESLKHGEEEDDFDFYG